MSDTANTTIDWETIANDVGDVVSALTPLVSLAIPGAGAAIAIGTKIVQGAIAAEPTAVALYNQISSGTPATPAQLQQFAADYEAAYQQLDADIKAKLAALPTA